MSEPREWTQEQAVAFAEALYPLEPGKKGSVLIGYIEHGRCCIGTDDTMLTPLGRIRIPSDWTGDTWREAAMRMALHHAKEKGWAEAEALARARAESALTEYERAQP